MRTPLNKATVSLAWAKGKYLIVITGHLKGIALRNRTLEFMLTQAKRNKGKMRIPNEEAVGLITFPRVWTEKDREAAAACLWAI